MGCTLWRGSETDTSTGDPLETEQKLEASQFARKGANKILTDRLSKPPPLLISGQVVVIVVVVRDAIDVGHGDVVGRFVARIGRLVHFFCSRCFALLKKNISRELAGIQNSLSPLKKLLVMDKI